MFYPLCSELSLPAGGETQFRGMPPTYIFAVQATRALALRVRVRLYCFVLAFSSYGSTTDSFGLLGFENR